MQPAPVFLPGESHGQRSLEAYSPQGRKESDTTERVSKSSGAEHLRQTWVRHGSTIHSKAKSLSSCESGKPNTVVGQMRDRHSH